MGGLRTRDTDADWRHIGATEPFWGVDSLPRFRAAKMDEATRDAFYASGRAYVAALAEDVRRVLCVELQVDRALDFGCGVGRLCEAMTAHARQVTGYDVSPGMLEVAQGRGGPVRYVDRLPDERFDWINAFIVFQHIPPERGLAELDALLDRLAPQGLLSLHFTAWRETALQARSRSPAARLRGFSPPLGEVQMYDYELSAVLRRLNLAGVRQMTLMSTNHAGHHGVLIIARRSDPPEPTRY